jgi:hypothetical protein
MRPDHAVSVGEMSSLASFHCPKAHAFSLQLQSRLLVLHAAQCSAELTSNEQFTLTR